MKTKNSRAKAPNSFYKRIHLENINYILSQSNKMKFKWMQL